MPDREEIYKYAQDFLAALNALIPNARRSGITQITDYDFQLIFNNIEISLPIQNSLISCKPVIASDWEAFKRTTPQADAQTLFERTTTHA